MRFSLYFYCFIFSALIFAQEPTQPQKVGLVLSGGGAKGLAHIGVLKALEEAQISIDYIAGSSMGAVIGGLYAAGYSAQQLDSLFRGVDFQKLFNESLSREQLDFYEKEIRDRYAFRLDFDGFKWSAPSAFATGREFYHLLFRWLQGQNHFQDFKKLPIPFICAATDLETGESVYIDSGYLALAINASAALPTLFQPVTYQGRWLMDGGISDNYPVEVLLDKGLTHIIGVDVQDDLYTREKLQTAPQILLQIANFGEIETRPEKVEQTDCYIKLPLDPYGILSFADGPAIIEEGYRIGKTKIQAMDWSTASFLSNSRPQAQDLIQLSRVHIEGLNQHNRRFVLGKMRLKPPEKLTLSDLQSGIDRLSATQYFQNIRYYWDPEETDALTINLRERQAKTEMKLGLHYDDLYKSSILVNIAHRNTLFSNDLWSLDMIFGDQPRYNFNYSIFNGYYWGVALHSSFHRFTTPVDNWHRYFPQVVQGLLPEGTFDLTFSDWTHGIRLERILGEWMQIRLGAAHKSLSYVTRSGGNLDLGDTILSDQQYLNFSGEITIDKRNDIYFPSRGIWFQSRMDQYWSEEDSDQRFVSTVKGIFQSNSPLGTQTSLQAELSGGFTYGERTSLGFPFIGGGYGSVFINNSFPFLGYRPWQLHGNSYLKLKGRMDFRWAKKHHLNLTYSTGLVDNDLFDRLNEGPEDFIQSWSLGYGYESFLGPCEIQVAQGKNPGSLIAYFALGYRF